MKAKAYAYISFQGADQQGTDRPSLLVQGLHPVSILQEECSALVWRCGGGQSSVLRGSLWCLLDVSGASLSDSWITGLSKVLLEEHRRVTRWRCPGPDPQWSVVVPLMRGTCLKCHTNRTCFSHRSSVRLTRSLPSAL